MRRSDLVRHATKGKAVRTSQIVFGERQHLLRVLDSVERSALPATGEREWYEADLIGLAAVGRDGRDWGKVLAFHDFGAGRTMEISGGGGSRSSVMLPFTDAVVPEIDIEGGKVLVDPPAGVLAGGSEKEA